jgi:hypothetical protein
MPSRRPSALALIVLAVLGCATGLAASPRRASRALPLPAVEVSARRAPSFDAIPLSRREDAVLRSQPELQILAADRASNRAKPARSQAGRAGRVAGSAEVRRRADGERGPTGAAGAAAVRLRAPPSPA